MNEAPSQTPPEAAREAVDDQGRLIEDIGCRRCAYNLRSLETDAVCPECGAAVAISIHGYYLRFAPLAWVRRLALGAKLLIASIATAFVGGLAIIGIPLAMPILQNPSTIGPPPTLILIIFTTTIGFSLIVTGLLIAGVILLTARDPAEVGKPERFGSRRLARYCLWSIPVATVGYGGMLILNNTGVLALLNPFVITIWIVIGIASVVSHVIMPAAILRRFIGLMTRIPRPGLVKFARIEFWAYLVVTVLGFGVYALALGVFLVSAPATVAATAATTTVTTTAAGARLSQLGYAAAPSRAPTSAPTGAPTSAPAGGAAGSTVKTYTFVGGRQVMVTTSAVTTMPATMPFAATTRIMGFTMIGAIVGVLTSCGGFAVAIAGLVFLIMSARALAKAAKRADAHTPATAAAAVPPA